MADAKFELQIVTPERVFYDKQVDRVIFRTMEGDIGVLQGHIPLTVGLSSGTCVISSEDGEYRGVVHGGFAEIREDKVTILTDAAEWPDEIDVERAKRALERAEKRLIDPHYDEVRVTQAKSSVVRALARLEVMEHLPK